LTQLRCAAVIAVGQGGGGSACDSRACKALATSIWKRLLLLLLLLLLLSTVP
jgi:hypothetical protein